MQRFESFTSKRRRPAGSEATGRPQLRLEVDLCCQLQNSRTANTGVLAVVFPETAARQLVAPAVCRSSRWKYQLLWRTAARRIHPPVQIDVVEIGMIEDIERFQPKLEIALFIRA